jgi:hypothetical protein
MTTEESGSHYHSLMCGFPEFFRVKPAGKEGMEMRILFYRHIW